MSLTKMNVYLRYSVIQMYCAFVDVKSISIEILLLFFLFKVLWDFVEPKCSMIIISKFLSLELIFSVSLHFKRMTDKYSKPLLLHQIED